MKESPEDAKNRELMMQLTGFADAILTRSGNMEIYEETYERIAFKIKQLEPKGKMTNKYSSILYLSRSFFILDFEPCRLLISLLDYSTPFVMQFTDQS